MSPVVATSIPVPLAVAIIGAIGLVAIFPGGLIVGGLLRRLDMTAPIAAADSRGGRRNIKNAGRYIGWLERALIFTVIVAGMPAGAALVLGVKTAARFPQFEKEDRFVEYYLIGTLLSLSIALAAALGARAILGLSLSG